MLSERALIREAAQRIAEAVSATLVDFREGLFEQEPNFTDRMLGRIAAMMDGYKSKGVIWHAKTLSASGPNSQERRFGADFVAALSIDLPDYTVQKGFLAQAKLFGKRSPRGQDSDRLVSQCQKMLALSPASFVFAYSQEEVRVIPALAILASAGAVQRTTYNYSRSVSRFYEEHFACFIGDPRINSLSEAALMTLVELYEARQGLLLAVEPLGGTTQPRGKTDSPLVEPVAEPAADESFQHLSSSLRQSLFQPFMGEEEKGSILDPYLVLLCQSAEFPWAVGLVKARVPPSRAGQVSFTRIRSTHQS